MAETLVIVPGSDGGYTFSDATAVWGVGEQPWSVFWTQGQMLSYLSITAGTFNGVQFRVSLVKTADPVQVTGGTWTGIVTLILDSGSWQFVGAVSGTQHTDNRGIPYTHLVGTLTGGGTVDCLIYGANNSGSGLFT